MIRALIRLLWGALVLLIVVPLMLLWLLGTPPGARFVFDRIADWVPGLQVESVEGRLLGPLEIRGLSFDSDAVHVEVDRARLEWSPRALWLNRLRVRDLDIGHVIVQTKPTPPDDQPMTVPSELPLGLRLRRVAVQTLELRLDPAQPPLVFEAIELKGRWSGNRIRLDRLAATVPELGALVAGGAATLEPERVLLQPLRVQGPGAIELSGELGYAGDFDLRLDWTDLHWPRQGEPLLRSAAGSAEAKGSLQDYLFSLQARIAQAEAAVDLELMGQGSESQLRVQQLKARGLGGSLDAQGELRWQPSLQLAARGSLKGIRPERIDPRFEGLINGRFSADTDFIDGRPQVSFEAQLTDSRLRGYPLALEAQGRYADEVLTLTRGDLVSGKTRLSVQGRLLPDLDAKAQLNSPDLAPLWPGLAGSARLNLAARGPLAGPRIAGELDARRFAYDELSLAALKLKGEVDLRGASDWRGFHTKADAQIRQLRYQQHSASSATLQADLDLRGRTELKLRIGDAEVAGNAIPSASLDLQGRVSQHRLRLAVDSAQGDVELAASGGADAALTRWKGSIDSGRLAPARLQAWTLQRAAALSLSAERIELQPACWRSGSGQVCTGLLRDAQLQRLTFRLDDFSYAYLQPLLPPGWELDGRVGGSGQIDLRRDGTLDDVVLDLNTTAGTWRNGGKTLLEFLPGRISVNQDSGPMRAQMDLPFAQGRIRLDASLAPGSELMDRALDGELQVVLPELSWLRLFSAEVSSMEGSIDGRLQFGGTLAQPVAGGALKLRDGKLRLSSPGIEIGELQGQLRGGVGGALDLEISGRSGDGDLRVAGRIDPQARPLALDLTVKGENFQAAKIPDARVWISPDLRIALQGNQLQISGEVDVPRAEITPVNFASGVAPSKDQVIVGEDGEAPPSGLLKLLAEVRVKLGDKVSFAGFGLKSRLTGAVTIFEETGRQTRAAGEVNLVEGRYQAYGQDLTIQTGRLIYSGGFVTQPALELKADRELTDEVTVGVIVRGTLDKPNFSLYSTPAMTQQQQLSWLVLGRPLEEGGGENDRAMLANAALALGLSGGDFLAQKLRKGIGLDEISIGSRPGEDSNQARLTVGKYLSPKLYISYGIGLFQPGNIFRLIYDLGRGFKLQTESGVESGGDLLYTIER